MNYNALEEQAGQLVTYMFSSSRQELYPYHNLAHTQAVVLHTKEIAQFYKLDSKDYAAVVVAAWFHDAGQLSGEIQDHEQRGVEIMEKAMTAANATQEFIELVAGCIMATKKDSIPLTLPEKIIRDADTYHFGTVVFRETEFLMRKEMELRTGTPFPYWHQGSLQFLQNHVFYTEYCQLLLNAGKKENMEWLASMI